MRPTTTRRSACPLSIASAPCFLKSAASASRKSLLNDLRVASNDPPGFPDFQNSKRGGGGGSYPLTRACNAATAAGGESLRPTAQKCGELTKAHVRRADRAHKSIHSQRWRHERGYDCKTLRAHLRLLYVRGFLARVRVHGSVGFCF